MGNRREGEALLRETAKEAAEESIQAEDAKVQFGLAIVRPARARSGTAANAWCRVAHMIQIFVSH